MNDKPEEWRENVVDKGSWFSVEVEAFWEGENEPKRKPSGIGTQSPPL